MFRVSRLIAAIAGSTNEGVGTNSDAQPKLVASVDCTAFKVNADGSWTSV